jgi:hypothetical protein
MWDMRKTPPLLFVIEDPLLITTDQVIMTIGSRRYALDISTSCTELKPSPAEVIPIDGHIKERRRKTHLVTEPINNAD